MLDGSLDWLDPRTWGLDDPLVRPLYLSDTDAALVALLDAEDHEWARQWRWSFTTSKLRKNGKEKFYAVRTLNYGDRSKRKVYLHKEVVLRARGPAPSSLHTIGDHLNGNSLDCRRANLRWATPSMNRLNVDGRFPWDLFDEETR